jgi:hypothetical protein
MKLQKIFFPLALFLCLSHQSTIAQEEPRIHRFNFSVVILDPQAGNPNQNAARTFPLWYANAGEDPRPIIAGVGSKSPLYDYEGELPFVFFRLETQQLPDGSKEEVRIPLANIAEIPKRAERLLFILLPQENGRYRHRVIDYSSNELPSDHIMMVNLTDNEIAFTIGEERPRPVGVNQNVVVERKGSSPFKFYMRLAAQEQDNSWKILSSNFYTSTPGTRQMFIIHRINWGKNRTVQQVFGLDDSVYQPDDDFIDAPNNTGQNNNTL